MKKIKVMTVFGTRPEATKMCPLVLELKKRPEIEAICTVTAQHRGMLDQALAIFGVKPDYDLDIMQQSQTLSSIVVRALDRLDGVMKEAAPDIVLVHGDTSTTFVGALAAFYHKIKVGHVEAGLRTNDKYSPYPEEINRRLVAPIADLHFCPTELNQKNLEREAITQGVYITGNTAIDAVKMVAKKDYTFSHSWLNDIDYASRRVIFMTAHRRENYGEPFENIMRAVKRIVEAHPDTELVYAMHLSPYVQETAKRMLGDTSRVHLCDPLDYDVTLNLINRSYLVLTDSGGIQEEAPALGKPVIVLRKETERPEAIYAGTAALAGTEEENIFRMADALLSDPEEYKKMAFAVNPYGDGQASRRITDAILHHFGAGSAPDNFSSGLGGRD